MKKLVLCMAVLSLLSLGGSAFAVKDAADNVPAATLLLPYFEVDLTTLDGVTTLFSINNASAVEQLAHVTVWSNNSRVVFDFDVYLTGYDVATFNMRDVLNLQLAPAAASWNDGIWGDWSLLNPANDYVFCSQVFPGYPTYDADHPGFKAHVQALLTGRRSAITGFYAGCPVGNFAVGYVTVDTVRRCNILNPADPAYWAANTIADANVLWGDYFYVNPSQNFAQGETLVHIESFYPQYQPGQATFYGRYVGYNGIDGREPLATSYASRFIQGGAFTGGTSLIVWREGLAASAPNMTAPVCTAYRTWDYAIFDEEENPWQKFCISGDPTCEFPTIEASRVKPSELWVPFPYTFGWLYWNLNYTGGLPGKQAWITTVMDANGRFSVGFDAIGLDNANFPIRTTIYPFD